MVSPVFVVQRFKSYAIPLGVFVLSTTFLWVLRPLIISGDGVGYIKRLVTEQRDIVPGHLAYVPLLEWLTKVLVPDGGHGGAAIISTLFSSLSGGAACVLLFLLARRLTGATWPGLVAAAGLVASFGFYRASGDVEAYATCVALMTGSALALIPGESYKPGWGATVGAGVLLALCTLMHTSLVLFTPFVFVAAWAAQSWKRGAIAVLVGGFLSLSAFLAVSFGVLGQDLSGTVSWILTSDNGYAQKPEATLSFFGTNAGRVFYGIGRTLIHSPAPDRLGSDASFRLSAVGISFFVLAAFATVWLWRRLPKEDRKPTRALWGWAIPLVLFGFLFWPSATERWVLVLPCMWLVAAMALTAIQSTKRKAVCAAALLGIPIVVNIVTVSTERLIDVATLERSDAISDNLAEGDTLLYPGHTWDEYVGFYEDAPVERFILASFAGEERGDQEAFLSRLRRRIDATHARGGRVLAVRVFDAPDSHHGWSLLRAMEIPRDDVLAVLAEYEAARVLAEPVGLWEIRPATPSDDEHGPIARRDQ